ncbi:MAG: hypothetical protein JNN20_04945, partial [Betaproteobacteria bacterium]|nr:hypothetical protein [Betaproteobacteria bacterium]
YHLAEDNSGALWAAVATSGLVRIANGEAKLFTVDDGLPANSISALRVLANGELWVGTANGLAVLRDGKFVRNPTGTWLDGASIAGLVEDRQKNLWFATNGQGIAVREGNTVRRFGKREGLSTEALTRILTDRDGGVWVGSLEGIYRLVGNNFERFGTPDGFTNNYVRDIFEDGEGSVWIGTDSGINRFRDATITTWGVRKGLTEEFARAVLEDRKGRIWVATADGLFAMTGSNVRRYGREHGLLNGAILSLAEDGSGNLWVGSNAGGLHRLNGERFEQLSAKFGVPAAPVRAILPARDGVLWIGTGSGLMKASWKQDAPAKLLRMKEGLPNEQVSAIHEDAAGRIWVGTRGGLGMIAPGAEMATSKGFDIDASVLAINSDADGHLWVNTGSGMWVAAAGAKLRQIKPEEGIPIQAYFHSLDDMAGHVWSCGNRGIVKIRKTQLDELLTGKRSKLEPAFYGRSEGMTTAQCNGASQPAGWRTRDGRLMFPTARGVAVAEPGREATRDLRAPPVHVKEVLIDTERVEYGAERYIAVPPGKHRVEISYVGLSMADPEKVRYRYQLKGFDAAWVEAGREAKAVYTNVAPGKYEFRVITSREGGAWSEDGSTLTIEQRPHFYETIWFRVVGALAIILAGLAVYRARIAQLNAQGVRLQQMVDERTQAL